MAIPSSEGFFPLDIVPTNEILRLVQSKAVKVSERLGLVWKGKKKEVDLPLRFIYFESNSIKREFPKAASPVFKYRLDKTRKEEALLSYKSKENPRDFKLLKEHLTKSASHTTLLPLSQFLTGNFSNVFDIIEITAVVGLSKNPSVHKK